MASLLKRGGVDEGGGGCGWVFFMAERQQKGRRVGVLWIKQLKSMRIKIREKSTLSYCVQLHYFLLSMRSWVGRREATKGPKGRSKVPKQQEGNCSNKGRRQSQAAKSHDRDSEWDFSHARRWNYRYIVLACSILVYDKFHICDRLLSATRISRYRTLSKFKGRKMTLMASWVTWLTDVDVILVLW